MTVQQILNYINELAPTAIKEPWDNVGLLCGRREQSVRKILVALDPFRSVCREAAEVGADLIVTHHPLIFEPVKAVTDENTVCESILFLAEHGIAAINAHTNLDCAPGGVNDTLAELLGLQEIQVPMPMGQDEQGRPYGLLRSGTVEEQPLETFLVSVKEKLGTPVLRYVNGRKPVRKVAVGGGSCGGALHEALAAGCDTFVTADIKYNQFWDAQELGLNLIDAGHFYTENPVCAMLACKLRKQFPELEVVFSAHRDCMLFH